MADKRKALGRGLDALLPSAKSQAKPAPQLVKNDAGASGTAAGPREVALELIDANPYQTRVMTDPAALEELAASIRVSGVLQPVLLRPLASGRFQLMAGQRRVMASLKAGRTSVPAVVRAMSDQQAMETTIVENLQREDLNAIEQAMAFGRLSREFKLTQDQIAERTGKERTTVTNFMRLLKLPQMVQQAIGEGAITMGHGKALLGLPPDQDETVALYLLKRTVEKQWNVRQLEEQVERYRAGSGPARVKKDRVVDANVRAIEERLQSSLGCKVEIEDKGGKGKVVLYYDDL